MLPSCSFRHTRRAFADGAGAGGLAVALTNCGECDVDDTELIDFTPPLLENTYEHDPSLLISALSREIATAESDVIDLSELSSDECERIRNILERLGSRPALAVTPEHEELLSRMRKYTAEGDHEDDTFQEELDFSPPQLPDLSITIPYVEEVRFEEPARNRMRVHVELLPDGSRVESFSNGSMLTKDILGRVVEVRSTFGDSLFLGYGAFGHLEEFARTDSRGFIHSSGRREKHGVAVRDAEGRVRAAGESMTIDPCGCFFLHTLDGQYFCLDLVSGTHSERRRIFQPDGSVDFLTAIFAHDGFRMASMYAVSGGSSTRYRFYGRDGTIVEFRSEEDVRCCRPAAACAPGTKPVHKTWLKRPQARTAWESVYDYLSRVS